MHTVGDVAEALLGNVPTPLRRVSESGTVCAVPLAAGVAARVLRAYGGLTVFVAESIPPNERAGVAEHCYAAHRQVCCTATCATARALVETPREDVTAVSA